MIDTDKYMEDVEERYNVIMNMMDDEEREFEIKTRIRERNRIMVAAHELDTEIKRLMHCLRYVGARLYLDKNGYRPYDYTELLEFCMDNTREPDDMSGPMGAMITELIHYDEKLEVDKEMSA